MLLFTIFSEIIQFNLKIFNTFGDFDLIQEFIRKMISLY